MEQLKHIIVDAGQIILGLVMHGLMLPLVAPVLLVFWVISLTVKLLLYLEYGPGTTKCSGLDSVWGVETPKSRPIITIMFTLVGTPSIEKVRKNIKSKLLDVVEESGEYRYPKFRQRLLRKFGYYVWQIDPDFDITNHIKLVNLGNDDPSSYASQPEVEDLPKNKAPWKITLLDSGEGRYSVLIFLHHTIGDGISLLHLCLVALADFQPSSELSLKEQEHPFTSHAVHNP
ncbi:unnamed protein product [Meganyctiphanes norvegica]|uniref:O-acyltransferase WSD1-like N-terminal domain-containing protein n=1 Tax=Meganyctiphanes norvegica TaxID=48144 RepID=A0AAV2SQK1_MEGNR